MSIEDLNKNLKKLKQDILKVMVNIQLIYLENLIAYKFLM